MTKVVLAALAIAALAPVAAQGGTVIAAPALDNRPAADAPLPGVAVPLAAIGQLGTRSVPVSQGFSLTGLLDGVDHVLTSVDADEVDQPNPFDDGAAGFGLTGTPARRAGAAARVYDLAEAATTEPLPEPATWLMMILGFFGLSFAVRRRGSPSGDRVRFS